MIKKTLKILGILIVLAIISLTALYFIYKDRILLFGAAEDGDRETFAYLVDEVGVDPNVQFRGINPISIYIIRNHNNLDIDFIKFMLDKGVNPNIHRGEYIDLTPLFHAINTYRIDIVELLINKGANINISKNGNITPLRQALQIDNCDIAKLLYKHGATLANDKFEKDYKPKLEQCLSE